MKKWIGLGLQGNRERCSQFVNEFCLSKPTLMSKWKSGGKKKYRYQNRIIRIKSNKNYINKKNKNKLIHNKIEGWKKTTDHIGPCTKNTYYWSWISRGHCLPEWWMWCGGIEGRTEWTKGLGGINIWNNSFECGIVWHLQ